VGRKVNFLRTRPRTLIVLRRLAERAQEIAEEATPTREGQAAIRRLLLETQAAEEIHELLDELAQQAAMYEAALALLSARTPPEPPWPRDATAPRNPPS
jgi:hypothetical protein